MKPLVAVLGGGVSPEHDVSLVSSTQVLNGLAKAGFPTLAVWVDPQDRWHLVDGGPPEEGWTPGRLRGRGKEGALPALVGAWELVQRGVEVVFAALHGRGGEDGHVQALLDAAEIPYVGSGRTASSIGMSKLHSRLAFVSAGLPMPPAYLPGREEARQAAAPSIVECAAARGLRYPLYLKEDGCGSSLGVERIGEPAELAAALGRVREAGDYWVLEEGVPGTELTCAVLGNSGGPLRALPPVEIRPRQSAFFDYASKYDGEATEELCPPPGMAEEVSERVQALALAAHEVVGCRGFSRTDMILDGSEPKILEINTIPGLTPESLLPKAARAAGMSFEELMAALVELALQADERIVLLPRVPRRSAHLGGVHERELHGHQG